MKQGGKAVTDYYTEILSLWQELDLSIEQVWDCAGDSVRFKQRVEDERVFEFLAGLNHELDDVRGRILSHKPLPSTREVFSEVRREEKRRLVMLKESGLSAGGPELSALLSKESVPPSPKPEGIGLGIKGPKPQSGRPWCEHCRKPGHTKDTCWEIHGKPPNWKPCQNNRPRSYQAQAQIPGTNV